MKREKLLSCLCGGLLAFCIGFGSAACMATGLNLSAELPLLALVCALCAMVAAGCFWFRRGGLILAAATLIYGFYLAYSDDFLMELLSMAGHTLAYYDRAYGLEVSDALLTAKSASHLWPLMVIGGGVATIGCWSVCRAKGTALTVLLAMLPLSACLVVTDTVPDAVWIYLLLLGLSLLILTQTVRRRYPGEGNRLTALLAVPVAAALTLLFLLIPQEGYQPPELGTTLEDLFGRLEGGLPFVGTTPEGELVIRFDQILPDDVDLGQSGKRTERNTPVMQVTATYSGTLYLRGRDYDQYDGKKWTASEDRSEDFGLSPIWADRADQVTIKTYGSRSHLYLPYYPAGGQLLEDGRAVNTEKVTEYTVHASRLRGGWESVWRLMCETSGVVGDAENSAYLELPEETADRAQAILRDMIAGQASADMVELAEKIADYVRSSAEYDLNPGKMPEDAGDFALWFLEESDKGYCVHFASATVVLLRAAGIPARYVEGFMFQTLSGQTTVVRDKMAHAWAEYYVPGVGWVILEATPADTREPEQTAAPTQEPTRPTEPATTPPTKPSETAPVQTVPSTTQQPSAPEQEERKESGPKWIGVLLIVLASLTAGVGLVWGQWRLRRNYIINFQHSGSDKARALAQWRETVRLCRLLKRPPPEDLRALAEKAKFSQHPITAEELSRFANIQRELVKQMRSQRWYRRLVYRLIFAAY